MRTTDAGRELLTRISEARDLLHAGLEAAREAGAARTGRLRLGFIGSFTTFPAHDILNRLRRLHPGLNVQLNELGTTELVRKVITHELDCAWIASWRSSDPVLVFEPLWKEPLYLAMPAARARRGEAKWADLSGEVLLSRPEAELDLLYPMLDARGLPRPEVRFHDCSRESLVSLVADGDGFAILPESFACLGRPGVRFAPIAEAGAEVAVCVTYRRDRDNPALRRLLAVTRDWLRENQPMLTGSSDRE